MRNKHGRRTVHAPYALAPRPFARCLGSACLMRVYEMPGQLAWSPVNPIGRKDGWIDHDDRSILRLVIAPRHRGGAPGGGVGGGGLCLRVARLFGGTRPAKVARCGEGVISSGSTPARVRSGTGRSFERA